MNQERLRQAWHPDDEAIPASEEGDERRPEPQAPAFEPAGRAAGAGDHDGEHQRDDQELAELDAQVEGKQRQQEAAAWQADLA